MSIALTEPAAAGAAGRCLAARVRDPERRRTTDHPMRCGWCDYPQPELGRMLERYRDLLDFDDVHGTYTAGTYEWAVMSREQQQAAITAAQELEAEHPQQPDWLRP